MPQATLTSPPIPTGSSPLTPIPIARLRASRVAKRTPTPAAPIDTVNDQVTSHAQTSAECGFMTLSTEIRIMILRLAFDDKKARGLTLDKSNTDPRTGFKLTSSSSSSTKAAEEDMRIATQTTLETLYPPHPLFYVNKAIAREAVEIYHGRIMLESDPFAPNSKRYSVKRSYNLFEEDSE